MTEDIKQREGEIWAKDLYYFYCPVCEKPYNIEYDASTRKSFDGKYEDNTCFIAKGRCQFCETKLSIAYDADHQGVVAYDIKEEKRWKECSAEFEKAWKKLQKVKKQLKEKSSSELKKEKKSLQKNCDELEKRIIDRDNEYEEQCLDQVIAREAAESVPFPLP